MKYYLLIVLMVGFCALPSTVLAMHAFSGSDSIAVKGCPVPMTFTASVEYIRGTSNEYVFDSATGQKISQLDWDLEDIVMAGGVLTARVASRLQLNLGVWTAVNQGNGHMVDLDWDPPRSSDWSHWSLSPIILEKGYMIDFNAAIPLDVTRQITLSPLIGFKFDNWKWVDQGGEFIYSRSGGWRNHTGSFPDQEGIRYEQRFFVPYLGMNLGIHHKQFFANAYVKGSFWAWSRAEDQHLNRSLRFKDTVKNQSYIGTGVEVGWHMTEQWFLLLGYDFQKFITTRGDSWGYDASDGSSWNDPNSAGIGHHSSALHFSLGFKF